MRTPLLLVVALVVASPSAGTAAATPLDVAAVLHGVQSWLDSTETLQGRFEQSLVSGALGSGPVEQGRLYVRRPGRMRWEYTDPESKIAVIDGDRTWFWIESERQMIVGRLDEQGDLLPGLLAGQGRLDELFEVSLEPASRESAGDGPYRLRLVPRPLSDALESVVLTVRPPRFEIEQAEVLDAGGNRMVYRFGRLRRNRALDDDLFRLEPPAGTRIDGAP